MQFNLYQINLSRDANNMAFRELPEGAAIDPSIYDLVYSGKFPVNNLEQLYYHLNYNHPKDYHCRSLSVSDVVEVLPNMYVEAGFYFCSDFGFDKINFKSEPECVKIAPIREELPSMKEIKEIRSLTGLSQQKFGDMLGIPKRTVQSWELGDRECPDYVINLIKYRVEHDKAFRKKEKETKKKSSAAKLEELRKSGADEATLEELSAIE